MQNSYYRGQQEQPTVTGSIQTNSHRGFLNETFHPTSSKLSTVSEKSAEPIPSLDTETRDEASPLPIRRPLSSLSPQTVGVERWENTAQVTNLSFSQPKERSKRPIDDFTLVFVKMLMDDIHNNKVLPPTPTWPEINYSLMSFARRLHAEASTRKERLASISFYRKRRFVITLQQRSEQSCGLTTKPEISAGNYMQPWESLITQGMLINKQRMNKST
jgi:hypothetical protein